MSLESVKAFFARHGVDVPILITTQTTATVATAAAAHGVLPGQIAKTLAFHLADGRDLYNHMTTSVGYASSSEAIVRFGLGAMNAAESVEIRWPGGGVQKLSNVAAGRIIEVTEETKP